MTSSSRAFFLVSSSDTDGLILSFLEFSREIISLSSLPYSSTPLTLATTNASDTLPCLAGGEEMAPDAWGCFTHPVVISVKAIKTVIIVIKLRKKNFMLFLLNRQATDY